MKLKKIVIIILLCIFMSGCWDKIEIDNKIFISTIAVDVGKDIDKQKELMKVSAEDPFSERQFKKLNITYGFPDISQISPGKGGTATEQFIKTEAISMEDGVSEATAKSSRILHLGHTQLLLLSSDVMAYPEVVKEIVDYLNRQPSLNKMMQVAVVDGKAEEYVKYKPIMEKNIESYITGLTENISTNSTILPVTLTELLTLLSKNGNGIIPRITFDKEKNELLIAGVAIIKNYAVKGYMNRLETSDLEILRGKIRGGKRVLYKDGHPVDFVIDGVERKIVVSNDKDKLNFQINMEVEGSIGGYYIGGEKLMVKDTIEDLQQNFSKSLSIECSQIAKITQKEFEVDPIGLNDYLEKFKPNIWNKVKGNWNEAYKNANISVNADVKIRRIGVVQ